MLKRRVAICLLFNDGVLFRTKKFQPDYRYTTNFVGVDAVDEVFLIDITRSGPSKASHEAMRTYAERCYSPVTMGGHIDNVDNVRFFFGIGADKVAIGARAACDYTLVGKIAQKYGAQAVTVGIDTDGDECFMASEGLPLPWKPAVIAKVMEDEGAGEIFLQSRERDGSLLGYDIENLKKVVAAVKIPVVVGTSCGNAGHMKAAFEAGASGCATANIHHFTENAIRGFKRQLAEYVRP